MGNFKRAEFACKCGCGFDAVDYELLNVLEDVRAHFDSPVIITSGCRCAAHNKSIGGSDGSFHRFGTAADIKVAGVSPVDVEQYLDAEYARYGLGLYDSWVHIDVRRSKARW